MLYELPNGEQIETDDVDFLTFGGKDGHGGADLFVGHGVTTRLHFQDEAQAISWWSNFLLLIKHCRHGALIDEIRLTNRSLKLGGMRPRTGEKPYTGLARDRWRLDQTVAITPRGCSPALASAITR